MLPKPIMKPAAAGKQGFLRGVTFSPYGVDCIPMADEVITTILNDDYSGEFGTRTQVIEGSSAALDAGEIPDLGIPQSLQPAKRDGMPPAGSITMLGTDCATPLPLDVFLRRPGTGCLSVGGDVQAAVDRIVFAVKLNSLVVSLPGQIIMESGMARKFCEGIRAHTDVSSINLTTIELSLQEAIINAVVHGNLGLGSAYKETADDLTHYHQMIRDRLANDPQARKPIDVIGWWDDRHLAIAVGDQGAGYETVERRKQKDAESPVTGKDRRRSGRGLEIIRRFAEDVTVANGGRTIIMSFKR